MNTIGDALKILEDVKGRTYEWKAETGRGEGTHYGLIAQEVEGVIPELVSTRELDDLRSGALGAATPTVDPAAAARLKEREENIWMKRVEPRVRQAPTPTARPQAVSAPRTPAATPRTSSASSTPASKSTGAKKSASPPKKRRR